MLETYKTILVPLDGSKQSELALNKAAAIAKRNNASLVLAHVIDFQYVRYISQYDNTMRDDARGRAEKMLRDYEGNLTANGVEKISSVVDEGTPKIKIATNLVDQFNVDLIVMGATGRNAIEKFFIGSTTEYVVRHALCDVLIIRNGAAE